MTSSGFAWIPQLQWVAERHARRIAADGDLRHDSKLGERVTRWKSLGQNTGVGRACKGLFKAFMTSSGHKANILGRWRFVGVGAKRRKGKLWVQQVFEWRRNPGLAS